MKTAEAAYYYSALKQDLKHYGIKAEIIIQEVEQLKSVVRIHKEAVKMGMINSENPMYIDLATHQILGGGLK